MPEPNTKGKHHVESICFNCGSFSHGVGGPCSDNNGSYRSCLASALLGTGNRRAGLLRGSKKRKPAKHGGTRSLPMLGHRIHKIREWRILLRSQDVGKIVGRVLPL